MLIFSLIIATYNAQDEISITLDSLARSNDKLKDAMEVIIIDGNSNDDTLDQITQFAAILPMKVVSELDKGIYDAWNKGIDLASGEWLIFLGAGDTINEEWLLCVNNFSNQNSHKLNNAVVVGYPLIQTPLFKRKLLMKSKVNKSNQIINFRQALKLPYLHSGSANHKSIFEKQKFDSNFKILGDLEFINRVKPILNFLECEQCYYSFGGISSSALMDKKQMEERIAIAKLYSIPFGWNNRIRLCVRNILSKYPLLYNLVWEIYLIFKC